MSFDADQMRRALDNLVLNAIEAAPAETAVLVAARHVTRTSSSPFTTRAPDRQPKSATSLFEPFVTGRADGTGLGLSIVREVAEAHGGTARLASATGTEQSSRSSRHGDHPDRR